MAHRIDTTFHLLLNPARGGSLTAAQEHLDKLEAEGLTAVHFGINFIVLAPTVSPTQRALMASLDRLNQLLTVLVGRQEPLSGDQRRLLLEMSDPKFQADLRAQMAADPTETPDTEQPR